MSNEAAKKRKRILIVSHRLEILTETGGTLQEFGITPDLVTAGTRTPPKRMVTVAMTGTLKNRLKTQIWQDWFNLLDLIVIDEAHQADFDWIFDIITHQYVTGFTATPKRKGNQRQLSGLYQKIVSGPDVQELINLKYLVPDRYFGAPVDLRGVRKDSFGEYKTDDLFKKFNTPELYAGIVDNWKRIAPGSQTLVFCVSIQHCIETAKAFNTAGVAAKFLTSEVQRPDPDTVGYESKLAEYENYQSAFLEISGRRGDVIGAWKRREFPVLINAGILTTGFNHKPIETVIINRATTSENLWLQMLGRGSRTSEGKQYFNLLDFGENARRLGHYRQQREYSLTHFVGGKKDGVISVKECPKCGALVLASSRFCKYCGHEFQKSKKEQEVELVQQTFEELSAGKAIAAMRTTTDIEIAAGLRGYKSTWVFRQIFYKCGKDEFIKYMRARNYQWAFIYRQINTYK